METQELMINHTLTVDVTEDEEMMIRMSTKRHNPLNIKVKWPQQLFNELHMPAPNTHMLELQTLSTEFNEETGYNVIIEGRASYNIFRITSLTFKYNENCDYKDHYIEVRYYDECMNNNMDGWYVAKESYTTILHTLQNAWNASYQHNAGIFYTI